MFKISRVNFKSRVKKCVLIATITLVILFLLTVLTVYVVVPIAFMLSFRLQELLMFTRFNLPKDPNSYDVKFPGLRNFYVPVKDIESNDTITLGVWHLLPWAISQEYQNSTAVLDYNELLANSTYNVIIHFHGTGQSRLDTINMLYALSMFFHVIAFDYRGYGDSTSGLMTERAVVDDCKQLYKWVQSRTNAAVYVWGHSLGASLALHTIAVLKQENIFPKALILESAFTTMREEIPVHPYGQLYAGLPWLSATILNPLEANGFHFNNSAHILEAYCPVMIFHAEDDSIIPLRLGQKLVRIARNGRNETMGEIVFHQIPAAYHCDHFWLYNYPLLLRDIADFLTMVSSRRVAGN